MKKKIDVLRKGQLIPKRKHKRKNSLRKRKPHQVGPPEGSGHPSSPGTKENSEKIKFQSHEGRETFSLASSISSPTKTERHLVDNKKQVHAVRVQWTKI